jgi:hypothetical protein
MKHGLQKENCSRGGAETQRGRASTKEKTGIISPKKALATDETWMKQGLQKENCSRGGAETAERKRGRIEFSQK